MKSRFCSIRNKICFLLALFIMQAQVFLSAQEIWISEEINLRNDYTYDIIPWPDGRVSLFRDKVFKYELYQFSPVLNLNAQQELEFDKKRVSIAGIFYTDTSFFVIYHYKKGGDQIMKFHEYDSRGDLIDSLILNREGAGFNTPGYRFATSEQKNKALIFFSKEHQAFEYWVIDVRTKRIERKNSFIIENEEWKSDFRNIIITDKGEAILCFERYNFWHRKKKHRIEIYYSADEQPPGLIEIPLTKILSYDLRFIYDPIQEKIIGAGSYSDRNSNRINGYYFIQVVPRGETSYSITTTEFKKETVSEIYGKEVNEKKGIKDLLIHDIVSRSDGGVVILGEMSKEYARRPNYPVEPSHKEYGFRRWTDFYFEDIVVMSLHPEGNVHWNHVLHKRQYSQDDDAMYSSYFLLKTPAMLRVIFNDEIKSENTVSEYVLSSQGLYERNSIINTDDRKLRLRFRDAVQSGPDEMIIPSQIGNKLSLVRYRYYKP